MRSLSKISVYLCSVLAVFSLIFSVGCAGVPKESPEAAPSLPEGVTIEPAPSAIFRDQVYCSMEGEALTFDLDYPASGTPPYPLVLYVHGGAWRMGDKMGGAGMFFKDALLSEGVAFGSINYRLAPKYIFPAQIEDVKCAVRFFRAHAALLELDPDRIAAMGGSAGGHLVSLLGLTAGEDFWDSKGQYLTTSSRVAAVVDLFGPTDLSPLADPAYRDLYRDVFGSAVESDADLWQFSPLAHVSGDAPPFLIIHGDADPVVFLHHSERFYQALLEAGVPVELVVVQGGGHSTDLFRAGASPNLETITAVLLAFLQDHLK